ncbi:MAG: replication-associated recombination protein A [Bacilli bacterium]|nr:replication-associated recombination protein A [Bacilli bacterium]
MELLQNKLRPNKLSDILGQTHLVGKDKVLTNLVKNKKIFNMILYGQSGIGKTTIALALVNELGERYRMLNATINSKKDFEIAIEEAKMYGHMILIVDEIHRMNKDKQDILLSYLENGTVILIGLTSLNPYHVVNPAIRSRCQLLELKALTSKDIEKGIKKVKEILTDIEIDQKTIKYISEISNGDIRFAYNLIEFAYYGYNKKITIENIKQSSSSSNFFTDKNDEGHYDMLSAFQKSIRGSDVDAALHYLARLIESGDYESIYRRMLVIAYEDIGLANPMMGTKVLSAIEACERIGFPEIIKPLSCAVIDMALSPKSNSADIALTTALEDVRSGNIGRIPKNIKTNSPTYLYPHNYPNYWVKQQYMPNELLGRKYYTPRKNKYEKELYEFNQKIKDVK